MQKGQYLIVNNFDALHTLRRDEEDRHLDPIMPFFDLQELHQSK